LPRAPPSLQTTTSSRGALGRLTAVSPWGSPNPFVPPCTRHRDAKPLGAEGAPFCPFHRRTWMLRFGHEPLPPVPDNRSGGGAPGALRPRPLCMESGGGAAVVVEAWSPPNTRIHPAMPAAHRSSRRIPVAGGWQRNRAAAGSSGLPRRMGTLVLGIEPVAQRNHQAPARCAALASVPTVLA
jgi:hypothetical protein